MTNHEFSKKDATFKKACELAEIPATGRQASKFRRKRGKAYDFLDEATKTNKEEKVNADD